MVWASFLFKKKYYDLWPANECLECFDAKIEILQSVRVLFIAVQARMSLEIRSSIYVRNLYCFR